MEENLKLLQNLELSILKQFVSICETQNLRYYLSEGTLLGAVRHNGFIPWDDDVDVCMPRADYEKFSEIAKSVLPSNLFLLDYQTANESDIDLFTVNKLYDITENIEWTWNGKREKTHPWIDIMPLDGLPESSISRFLQTMTKEIQYKLFRTAQAKRIDIDLENRKIRKMVLKFIDVFHVDRLLNTKRRLVAMNRHLERYDFDKSPYTYNAFSEYKTITKKECFEKSILKEFEGTKMRIPVGYDAILKAEYGNYMELPPESDRKSKHNVKILDSTNEEMK